jgi:DNA-binding LacI/PurR family transcriptional regulator
VTRATTVLAFARSTSGFYFGELLAGLTREVALAGGRVVVVQTLDPGDVADAVVRTPGFDLPVAWDQVSGAVSVSLAAGAPYLTRLRLRGIPVVLASSRIDEFVAPIALPDNYGGTFAAVEHLLAHGHTRIGFVGNLVQTDIRERYAAYQQALARHGLRPDARLFYEASDNTELGGRHAADDVASRPGRPTALMVATDRNALGLLDGLAAHGLSVPDDVAVVGFDNIEAGTFTSPTLSSVSQRFDEVGALAGRLVLAAVRGERTPVRPHTPDSVIVATRGSCGCASNALDAGAEAHPPAPSTSDDVLGRQVRELFASAVDVLPEAAVVADIATRVLQGPGTPSRGEVRTLVEALRGLGARPDVLHRVANMLIEHVERAPWAVAAAGQRGAEVDATQVVAALWQLQAETYLRRSKMQESLLTEQFRLSAGLLDASGPDARTLHWLEGTHARAGALAVWEG